MSYLQTTPVAVTGCPRCRQPILTGVAEGIRARVDPVAINHTGLIAAILAGRDVYRLTRAGLVLLDQDRIKSQSIHGPMVTAHKCGHPIPAQYRDTSNTPAIQEATEGIPY
jgi:hypothetical protein